MNPSSRNDCASAQLPYLARYREMRCVKFIIPSPLEIHKLKTIVRARAHIKSKVSLIS